jgi:hypothetical protein
MTRYIPDAFNAAGLMVKEPSILLPTVTPPPAPLPPPTEPSPTLPVPSPFIDAGIGCDIRYMPLGYMTPGVAVKAEDARKERPKLEQG